MNDLILILKSLSIYRPAFLFLFYVFAVIAGLIVLKALWKKTKKTYVSLKSDEERLLLTREYKGGVGETERQNVLRQIIASDGVNPNPSTYMTISDGGREIFVRSVTISKFPKNVTYADTLQGVLDFPDCTSTVFVEPVNISEMSRKLDKQINTLESEQISSAGNTNRVRRLWQQEKETTKWASEVESGDKKFFYCGFLFTFYADSFELLNKITDSFRGVALNKGMDISNCFCVQSEAYLSNMPLNRRATSFFKMIGSDAVKMHLMDQQAASVILNYTTDYFTHRRGVPLGRNLFNRMPSVFDLFDPSHDGFLVIVSGKVGSGKSAMIKIIIERSVPIGYRYVIIDSQTRKGTSEGEYCAVTKLNGGAVFQISSFGDNILNVFDVEESTRFIETGANSGYEVRDLDLNGAITEMIYTIRSMMQIDLTGDNLELDTVLDSDINRVVTQIIKDLFAEKGIRHGEPDSLYESGTTVNNGLLQSGIVKKNLPTISEFYKKLLQYKWANKDIELDNAYKFVSNNMREYVRELYYCEESMLFFSKEEFYGLAEHPDMPHVRIFVNDRDESEQVVELRGIRPYYDGQSTVNVLRECPITTIDISTLPEREKRVAREIAERFMNERFIKKNSEKLESADKLVFVVDEAHESFEYPYGRKTFSSVSRTARKRNVGGFFCTQTVVEFSRHAETSDILRQAAVKIVFKQDAQDEKALMELLNITENQARLITSKIGVVVDKEDPKARTKHRGEMCLIDGERVTFLKVDYIKSVEKYAVETDASSVISLVK